MKAINQGKNLATLLKECKEANKYFAKYVKENNVEAASMWAKKLEKIEAEIEKI